MSGTRPVSRRIADSNDVLRRETTAWVATSGPGGPHLVPLVFHYDGDVLTFATFADSATARNASTNDRVRVAVGHPYDVVMIDGTVQIVEPRHIDRDVGDAHASLLHGGPDPRSVPGLLYLQLRPSRIQAWRNVPELEGRTIMRDGLWRHDRATTEA